MRSSWAKRTAFLRHSRFGVIGVPEEYTPGSVIDLVTMVSIKRGIWKILEIYISFKKWWNWYQNFKGERSIMQSSAYLEFAKNPIYDVLRDKTWFKEIVAQEKEKLI